MKVLSVVGARPQFVKAAPLSRALRGAHTEILVHTGQHYDDSMSATFFRDLEIPEPDINLEVGSGPHGAQTAEMIARLEPVVLEHEPDGIILEGDTNSTLAGAVVGCKVAYPDGRRPWMAHVEAGLRSFNRSMPEEHNRIVADHLSHVLLAPTGAAMTNLATEGLAGRAVDVGDVMVDAHVWATERAASHLPRVAAEAGEYVLLTLHRAENVDDPGRLSRIAAALDVPMTVIFPVHPRTSASLARHGIPLPPNVRTLPPVGYLEMVALEARAALITTDSGGVQKEAYLSGVPCVTLREETEWVETVKAGWNRVVGATPGALTDALADPSFMRRDRPRPELFGDGHAAERIVAVLERHQAGSAGIGEARVETPQEAAAS